MNRMKRFAVLFAAGLVLIAVSLALEKAYVTSGTSACAALAEPTFAHCWKEVLERTLLHVIGGVFIVTLLHWSRSVLGLRSRAVLVFVIIAYFFIQEFYLHPLRYGQPFFKSVIDFLAWSVPLLAYVSALFLRRTRSIQTRGVRT